jgi:hypothetical protein
LGVRVVARDADRRCPVNLVPCIVQTTSIHVKAEKQRLLEAAARYYADDVE